MPRHYVAALPLLLVLGGVGIGTLIERLPKYKRVVLVVFAIVIGRQMAFGGSLYSADPGDLRVPSAVYTEYIASHSAGFGLRDAMNALPQTITRPELPVIGSMFPDGCRRANYYATSIRLLCVDAPGLPEIESALATYGAVYVLTDEAPSIGVDVATVDASAVHIAAYPRPDEDETTASVVLWLLERD
jgi:hypothetical protein